MVGIGVAAALTMLPVVASPVAAQTDTLAERQQFLVRMVRQDCGSCHGLRLKGGLGPALLPETLRDKPTESLEATVLYGRPGTAMPPFRAMLSEAEVRWIVERLMRGFPEESKR
jgi:cytochrome c55X